MVRVVSHRGRGSLRVEVVRARVAWQVSVRSVVVEAMAMCVAQRVSMRSQVAEASIAQWVVVAKGA